MSLEEARTLLQEMRDNVVVVDWYKCNNDQGDVVDGRAVASILSTVSDILEDETADIDYDEFVANIKPYRHHAWNYIEAHWQCIIEYWNELDY